VKPIPLTSQTSEAVRRIVWFEEPEKALADPVRFMAYALTYARHEDMRLIRSYVSDDEFREALDRAPPGIIDPPVMGLLEPENGPVSSATVAGAIIRQQHYRQFSSENVT
jgi:hypothetical protein